MDPDEGTDMLRSAGLAAIAIASATPASAQRTGENAVASAQDAFGTSVGNERVGLYFPQSARGFSPVQAGNVRINGTYFDFQTELNERLISGSNVRVGLTAQGYPFPAPTGVADFSLRLPGAEAVASTVVGIGPFGGTRLEVDAQLPLGKTLGVAAGVGVNNERSTMAASGASSPPPPSAAGARPTMSRSCPSGACMTIAAARRSRSSSPPAPTSRRASSGGAISARNGRTTRVGASITGSSPH
jgi:hypothetical protein